jgi:phage baseplate assembly protein V
MSRVVSAMRRAAQQSVAVVRQAYRAVLSGIDAKNPIQLIQAKALAGETIQDMEFFQHFGFTSTPPGDTECIILPLGGKTEHSIIIATECGQYRIAVQQGEVCVYNQWGAKMTFKKEKRIEIECDYFIVNAKEQIQMTTKESQHSAETIEQTASQQASYTSPALTFGGLNGGKAAATMRADINQDGRIDSTEDHVAGGKSLIHHVHPENDNGGPTGPPV